MRVTFEQAILALSVIMVIVCLFLPLVLVSAYYTEQPPSSLANTPEVTVGIAVILRATARRLLRSGAKGVLRTTIATFSRTVARTVTRRLVRFFVHSMVSVFSKQSLETRPELPDDAGPAIETESRYATLTALLIGFAALCLSFWGVLYVVADDVRFEILHDGQLETSTACFLAGFPLLVYGLVTFVLARWMHVPFQCITEIDGLFIQGYFTGAGSFLPVTTDFECEGTKAQNATVAACALAFLYASHLVLLALSQAFDSEWLSFAAGMFLVYSFVYSFPIKPLQGHDVWAQSKLYWLLIFIPILMSFLFSFPQELAQII